MMNTRLRYILPMLLMFCAATDSWAQNPKAAVRMVDREMEKELIEEFPKDRYIVVFKAKGGNRKALADKIRGKGGKVRRQFRRLRGAVRRAFPAWSRGAHLAIQVGFDGARALELPGNRPG